MSSVSIVGLGNKSYQIPHASKEFIKVGGDTKLFVPRLDMDCFLGESKLSFTPQVLPVTETVKSSEVEAGNSDLKFLWKSTVVNPDYNERGGVDIIITLHKKPALNYIDFGYDATRLIGYPQPGLEKWEIDRGDVQPDHVTNSIAWYHNTKGGLASPSDVGRHLTTGKAGHTYRMVATDALNNKSFADWTLEPSSIARLWIDNVWLKNAEYPVIISPIGDTFGYTTIGGVEVHLGTNRIRACYKTYSPAEDGDGNSFHIYGHDSGGMNECMLYDSGANLVANGIVTDISMDAGAAWKSGNFPVSPSVLSGSSYYMAHNREHSNYTNKDDVGTGEKARNYTYQTYPNPAGWVSDSYSKYEWSVYVTFTPSVVARTPRHGIVNFQVPGVL